VDREQEMLLQPEEGLDSEKERLLVFSEEERLT
jgi:hypothetical protein